MTLPAYIESIGSEANPADGDQDHDAATATCLYLAISAPSPIGIDPEAAHRPGNTNPPATISTAAGPTQRTRGPLDQPECGQEDQPP
jgi:hypothetical protein